MKWGKKKREENIEIAGKSSWRSGGPCSNTYSSTDKRNRFEGEDPASDSTVEIADTDRAPYYLRYRHDLCLPTARFSNFVGVPSFREIKEEGALSRKGIYVSKKCSDCAEEAEWIDKTVARKTDVRMQLITTAVLAVGKNPRHDFRRCLIVDSIFSMYSSFHSYRFFPIFSSLKNRGLRLLYFCRRDIWRRGKRCNVLLGKISCKIRTQYIIYTSSLIHPTKIFIPFGRAQGGNLKITHRYTEPW